MDDVIVDVIVMMSIFIGLLSFDVNSFLMFLSFTSSYDDYDNRHVLSLLMILFPQQ